MQKKNPISFTSLQEQGITIKSSVIAQISSFEENEIAELGDKPFYIIPLFNNVAVPDTPQPIKLEGEQAVKTAEEAFNNNLPVFVVTVTKDVENPSKLKDFYPIGVAGKIAKIIKLPDGNQIAFTATYKRGKLEKIIKHKSFLTSEVTLLSDPVSDNVSYEELKAMASNLTNICQKISNFLPDEMKEQINLSIEDPGPVLLRNLYGIMASFPFFTDEKLEMLSAVSLGRLMEIMLAKGDLALQRLSLQASIQMRTHENLSHQQKEIFLKQQIRSIQEELGESATDDDIEDLKKKAATKKWSSKVMARFNKELSKLEKINPSNPDYSIHYSYLETLLDLPWDNYSNDDFSLSKVERILDRDHYGLKDIKDRIIEQMAVIKLRNDLKAPIICFYGPPGVGKTSLGKSIADALGREYVRVSLGGVNDEAEIRGHRKTYIGAMPGRIISSLEKCKTGNPVFVLDEIDKINRDIKGDPSSALLEVLDPEQNIAFHDNYLDIDYDLSKVLFIATANDISNVSRPLLDRMELIEITGYIPDEKIEIAKKYLVPKCLNDTGLEPNEISFDKTALSYIINNFTRESGVRQLEKKISKVLRKIARLKASGKEYPKVITSKKVKDFLGTDEIVKEEYSGNQYAGVVTGLAWTAVGGEILVIETSLSKGKGDKLTLTGNLGDVMKESAILALEYIKAHVNELNVDSSVLEKVNVHIHVPEGAVPKDGPSAGITIATSIVSALTGRKVRERVAMTGEMTLRGKILPVGGIKEKILAAKRAGVTDIVLSKENKRHVDEIDAKYLKGLEFHYADSIEEVLQYALLNELADKRFTI